MSGALDGHVKVYDLQTFGMVYGMKYPSPILSMACSVRTSGDEIRGLSRVWGGLTLLWGSPRVRSTVNCPCWVWGREDGTL
jgi:hypothetical protein